MILGTFNGRNIIALPSDLGQRGIAAPSEVEWDEFNIVSAGGANPFNGSVDIFDWMAGYWLASLSFPSMSRLSFDYWSAFLSELRGPANVFLCGNPRVLLPKGSVPLVSVTAGTLTPITGVANAPVVDGANQTGYALNVRGLQANLQNAWLPGDLLQLGFRAYKVLHPVNVDSNGKATLSVWPPLRQTTVEPITDGQVIITAGAKTLYQLTRSSGNRYSITATAGNGFSQLSAREAL